MDSVVVFMLKQQIQQSCSNVVFCVRLNIQNQFLVYSLLCFPFFFYLSCGLAALILWLSFNERADAQCRIVR